MSTSDIVSNQSAITGKMITIAVVEDDIDDREFICTALRESGFNIKIIIYKDGSEFLRKLSEEKPPELILTDIRMPLITGFDVIRFVKTNKKLNHIPIVVLSTSANRDDIKSAKDLGAMAYYSKPFAIQDYCGIVTQIISSLIDKGLFPKPA